LDPVIDVPASAEELIAAWRPDARRLVLTTGEPLRPQQRIAARVSVLRPRAAATITGRVASARRQGNLLRIELVPDETRMRAVERLLEVARGESVDYQARSPRFLATLPAVVRGGAGPTYMTTFSVSEHGCGLTWSGAVPAVGVPMEVRLGAGRQVASFCGEVCWTARSGRASTVGVRFVAGAQNAWATILEDLRRSGAPPA
jgi:hypothetical protein